MQVPVRMSTARRGAIAPLTCVLLIFLIGVLAFSVDVGWIVSTRIDLQNAADSAALAGASKLPAGYVLYYLPSQTAAQKATVLSNAQASARATAKQYAALNAAGGTPSLVLQDSDIEFGYLDTSNNYTPLPTYTGYPNTIKVTLRRDSAANGSLRLFFGPALGVTTADVQSTASATIYGGTIDSFQANPSPIIGVLPVTYDVNDWNTFLSTGKDPNGNTLKDASGNPELQIYSTSNSKGNFGLLSLDDVHDSDKVIKGFIEGGMPASDIQTLVNNNLIPLSSHPANTWDWNGDNGFKASFVSELNTHVGQTFILPLFNPKNDGTTGSYQPGVGQGSNYFYDIVGFVGITIMQSSDTNRTVYIQPAPVSNADVIFASGSYGVVQPPPTATSATTIFGPPKLTR